jgi:hypothetical protein
MSYFSLLKHNLQISNLVKDKRWSADFILETKLFLHGWLAHYPVIAFYWRFLILLVITAKICSRDFYRINPQSMLWREGPSLYERLSLKKRSSK